MVDQYKAWNTFGGDNSRRGLAAYEFSSGPIQSHVIETGGSLFASPVFNAGGTVFIADMAGTVRAVGTDRKVVWKFDAKDGIHATPALSRDGSQLFVATVRGDLYALDANVGVVVWQKFIPTNKDPRILSDLLYLAKQNVVIASSWQEEYVALDADTGEMKHAWSAGVTPRTAASADADENVFFLRTVFNWDEKNRNGVELCRLSLDEKSEDVLLSQKEQEQETNEIWAMSAPVIDEDRKVIYSVSNLEEKGVLTAFSLQKKEVVWQQASQRQFNSTPAIAPDGTVIIGDMFGSVVAYAADGSEKYVYKTGAPFVMSSPVVDQSGAVFAGDSYGVIHRIDNEGQGIPLLEAARAIQSRPAFSPDKKLYVPSTDGNVYIFV